MSQGAVLADIGSDHAQLPCALVESGRIVRAYACDIKEGPLSQAKKTIASRDLTNQVIPVLSDGLAQVADDVSEVVIAGMGVHTVIEILEAAMDRLPHFHRIIVQANHSVELLRMFLRNHRYRILDEAIVWDEKYYEVVVFEAKPGGMLSDAEVMFGPFLLKEQSDVFVAYHRQIHRSYLTIMEQLGEQHERYSILKEQVDLIASHVLL